MSSQTIIEEFPATAETLDVPQQRKVGSLALVSSVEQNPATAENTALESPATNAPNKYALSFLKVLTKGYDLPEGLTQRDAEMFTEMALGIIHEVKKPGYKTTPPRESDEIVRQFVRGHSYDEISERLGHAKTANAMQVWASLTLKAVHERGYRPRKLHGMLEKFVALQEGPAVLPARKIKPETLPGQLNPQTTSFFKSLLKTKELPDTLTQTDAELFTEMVFGLINTVKESRIPRKEVDEEARLYIRGRSNEEISGLIGYSRSDISVKVQRIRDINTLHRRGYPPVVLKYMLDKFLQQEETVETGSVTTVPEKRTYKRRSSRVNESEIEGLDDLGLGDIKDREELDDLDAPAHTTDIVRSYLTDIGRVPLLTAEQEVQLAKQIEGARPAMDLLKLIKEDGLNVAPEVKEMLLEDALPGIRASNQMLEANLRLVVHWATRYQGKGVEFLDLIQEGNLGLAHGVEKFDHTLGYKFSTYASWWIRQALQRAIADKGSAVRIPVHMHERINKAVKVKAQLEDSLGRKPTLQEIADIIKETPDKTEEILNLKKPLVYLDKPVGEDKETSLGDFIPDKIHEDASVKIDREDMVRGLNNALYTLPERSRAVIAMRFGLEDGTPRTLDEVGKELGLTRERIRQIERDTLRDMREKGSAFQQFKDYMSA